MYKVSQKHWLNHFFHSEAVLQMDIFTSVEDILNQSKKVMTTMGEWELIGLTVQTITLPAGGDKLYQEICFFVRTYCWLSPYCNALSYLHSMKAKSKM